MERLATGCPPTVDSSTSAGTSALTAVCADGTDIDSLTTAGLYYYNDAGNSIIGGFYGTGIVQVSSFDNGNVVQTATALYNTDDKPQLYVMRREFNGEEWSTWMITYPVYIVTSTTSTLSTPIISTASQS